MNDLRGEHQQNSHQPLDCERILSPFFATSTTEGSQPKWPKLEGVLGDQAISASANVLGMASFLRGSRNTSGTRHSEDT